jgi:hypothetical protein
MNEQKVKAIFLLADIEVEKLFQIENGYWPDHINYAQIKKESPWWLVKTKWGLIKIGWRKRVIAIDWEDTPIRQEITTDDVTKELDCVHAYSYSKAIAYLSNWKKLAECIDNDIKSSGDDEGA